MAGLTFDTGALIALERRKQRMAKVLRTARLRNLPITVPAVVVTEWWRGQSSGIQALLRAVAIEPLTASVAQAAGEALAVTGNSNAVDAIVMASAASRGDIVYTSDLDDLFALQAAFPGVRVLHA